MCDAEQNIPKFFCKADIWGIIAYVWGHKGWKIERDNFWRTQIGLRDYSELPLKNRRDFILPSAQGAEVAWQKKKE